MKLLPLFSRSASCYHGAMAIVGSLAAARSVSILGAVHLSGRLVWVTQYLKFSLCNFILCCSKLKREQIVQEHLLRFLLFAFGAFTFSRAVFTKLIIKSIVLRTTFKNAMRIVNEVIWAWLSPTFEFIGKPAYCSLCLCFIFDSYWPLLCRRSLTYYNHKSQQQECHQQMKKQLVLYGAQSYIILSSQCARFMRYSVFH